MIKVTISAWMLYKICSHIKRDIALGTIYVFVIKHQLFIPDTEIAGLSSSWLLLKFDILPFQEKWSFINFCNTKSGPSFRPKKTPN